MTTSSPASPTATVPGRTPGRLWAGLGLGLAALGIAAYAVQLSLHRLIIPWYMPALATLGVLFLIVSLWRRRSLWRVLGLVLVVLLAGAEWAFLLGARLPAYTGPVAAGHSFPAFTTERADGTSFTENDLKGDQDNVLVFFRGRW
jgi:hypothetical protein